MQFVIVIKSYIPDFDYFQKLSIHSTIAYMYVKPIVIWHWSLVLEKSPTHNK